MIEKIFEIIKELLIKMWDRKEKKIDIKRNKLNSVYEELIKIIEMYPDKSPNDVLQSKSLDDILQHLDCKPIYKLELFDTVIRTLKVKVENYEKNLNVCNKEKYQKRTDIELLIGEIKNLIEKINEIKENYFKAKSKYESFTQKYNSFLELYAGKEVKENILNFEAVISNVFIAGYKANDDIKNCKNNLIESIKSDIDFK